MTGNMLQEHTQPMASSSTIRKLTGTQPGVLDPSQPGRLLRLYGAKLTFATFDPLTASAGAPDLTKLNLNADSYRPRRVVIETAPSGGCTWRFVPSAKREDGVVDEGTWPRIVDLCGEFVEITQDQWDIYKLDSTYECLVRGNLRPTTIRRVSEPHLPSPKLTGKHRMASDSPPPPRTMPPPRLATVKTVLLESESESEDESEVEFMVITEGPKRRPSFVRQRKEQLIKTRQERRGKIHQKMQFNLQSEETHFDAHTNGIAFGRASQTPERCSATPEPGKRKVTSVLDTSWSPDKRELEELYMRNTTNYVVTTEAKRTRTVSPMAARRNLKIKKMKRVAKRQQRWTEELEARKLERDKRMLAEILEETPPSPDFLPGGSPHYAPQSTPKGPEIRDDPFSQEDQEIQDEELLSDGEAAHRAAIEESRRKLAELERDKPRWEEQAQQRLREEAEQQALKFKMEQRRREEARKQAEAEAEAEAQARKQRQEEGERKRREQEERAQRERDLREQERRRRQQRWSLGPWTTQRALERYRILSEAFDSTKFTAELPLAVEDVPWPTLQSPRSFSIEDMNWDSVERFFEGIRPHLKLQDYKALVEKSHRRFHPDRWRSRNLLKTMGDETVRGCTEVAANTVAQALTPIWRSLTGR